MCLILSWGCWKRGEGQRSKWNTSTEKAQPRRSTRHRRVPGDSCFSQRKSCPGASLLRQYSFPGDCHRFIFECFLLLFSLCRRCGNKLSKPGAEVNASASWQSWQLGLHQRLARWDRLLRLLRRSLCYQPKGQECASKTRSFRKTSSLGTRRTFHLQDGSLQIDVRWSICFKRGCLQDSRWQRGSN